DFQIYLPRVYEGVSRPESVKVAAAAKGSETILLVEDEEALRKLAGEILRSCGYTVLEAGNGEDALGVSRASACTIPLLVTDMIMPGMNGRVLAESLRGSWPKMKVLYISGFTENILDLDQSFGPGTAFLQKPFTPAVLAQKVRELLDHAARRPVISATGKFAAHKRQTTRAVSPGGANACGWHGRSRTTL